MKRNKKSGNILKIVMTIFAVLVLTMLAVLIYCALMPRAINSQKMSSGVSLEFVKAYPQASDVKHGNFYQGKLYKAGKINVVVLEGTYEEMGRQYGALLKDELNANYNGIMEGLKKMTGVTSKNFYEEVKEIQDEGSQYYNTYPEKYKKIVEGLAETSGLGIEKAKFLTSQETYVFAALIAMSKGINISGAANCSGIAAWKDYTADGRMIFGRNYDLGPVNHEYATLVVYNPVDGSIPVASFTFAGSIYVTTGMNRDGLFLELNNGSASDNANFTGLRPFAPITLFNFLEQSKNLDELDVFFNSTLPDMAYIINAADKNYAYSFEWSTAKAKKRNPDKDGLLAATNLFFDPAWGKQTYDAAKDPDFLVKRRDNLLSQAEINKGKINPEKMMEIISTPLKDGGTFRDPNLTSYEIVAQPATLKVWLRIPEYQDWVEVDLAQLFNK